MKYEVWFNKIKGIGNSKKILLRDSMGSAEAIYYMEEKELRKVPFLTAAECEAICDKRDRSLIEDEYKRLKHKQISFFPYYHNKYPSGLKEIVGKPYGIYVSGHIPTEQALSVAIVGARNASSYGELMAVKIAEELARHQVQIISGLARGIDAAGHRGCLNSGGRTFGVIGCGLNICYPRENKGLFDEVSTKGGIISEFNLDEPPLPSHFPARNRIISALCDVLIIIEAKQRSGSLITADFALEQGKDIYALPGPVTSNLSYGCNNLIRQGAGIITSVEELIEEFKISSKNLMGKNKENKKMLETVKNLVYSCLDFYPKSFEQLSIETNMSVAKLMEELVTLELEGVVTEISKNYYVKNKL